MVELLNLKCGTILDLDCKAILNLKCGIILNLKFGKLFHFIYVLIHLSRIHPFYPLMTEKIKGWKKHALGTNGLI